MTKTLLRLALAACLAAGATLAQSSSLAVLTVPLSPSSTVPVAEGFPIGGEGVILIHMTRDASGALTRALVDFRLAFANETDVTIDKVHLHRGLRETRGPVAVNAMVGAPVTFEPGAHHLIRQRVLADQDSLEAVEGILADPSGHYLNVHSLAWPDGVMRGQLMHADSAAIIALQGQVDALTESNAALAGELATVKETLARIARRLGVVPAQ